MSETHAADCSISINSRHSCNCHVSKLKHAQKIAKDMQDRYHESLKVIDRLEKKIEGFQNRYHEVLREMEDWKSVAKAHHDESEMLTKELKGAKIAYKSNQQAAAMSAMLSDKNTCLERKLVKSRELLARINYKYFTEGLKESDFDEIKKFLLNEHQLPNPDQVKSVEN